MARRVRHWSAWVPAVAALGLVSALSLAAEATTYSLETGNSFATRTLLPFGTDVVQGGVSAYDCFPGSCGDVDYFAFTGLQPGSPYTITLTHVEYTPSPVQFDGYDALSNLLFHSAAFYYYYSPVVVTGTVPVGGEIVILAWVYENASNYEVSLDAQLVPEPSTALLLGAGLAALALRRRLAA